MRIFWRHRRSITQPRLSRLSPLELTLFPTDGPLPPEGMIGRDEEVAALVEGLTRGEHQILTASHRTGKSSVARAAVAALETEGWYSVTVDLFRTSNLAALIARLVQVDVRHPDASVAAPRSRTDSTLPAAMAEFEFVNDPPPSTLAEALQRLRLISEAVDRRVVLFIDEFQELATTQLFGRPDEVIEEIRTALDEATHLSCLFVGSVPYLMRALFTSKDQSFYAFGSVSSLPAIPAAAWRGGLRSRFTEGACEIEDLALDRLLELSRGHPRTTMVIAQSTHASARRCERATIGPALVEEGFDAALAGERAAHESELARVRMVGKHALATTLRIANGESAYRNLPPAVARQTLRSLETAGVLDHPRSRTWQLADPLFREYLVRTIDDPAETADPTGYAPPRPALTPAAAAIDGDVELDPALLSFRHPRSEEARDVGRLVTHVVASHGDAHVGATGQANGQAADASASTGRGIGRFIERTVTAHPDCYWQLEADGRPVGGLVLHRPRAFIGRSASLGADPLVQLALLAGVVGLTLTGFAVLVVKEAWTWGGLGGLLLAAFIGCFLEALLLSQRVLGRARASWIARRRGGMVFEGLWSEPRALPALFHALATRHPGALLTTHAATRERASTCRALGFSVGHGRVVAGALAPANGLPVRAARTGRVPRPRSREGEPEVDSRGSAVQRQSPSAASEHAGGRKKPRTYAPHGRVSPARRHRRRRPRHR